MTSAQRRAQKQFKASAVTVTEFAAYTPALESDGVVDLSPGTIAKIRGYAGKLNIRNANNRVYGSTAVSEAVDLAQDDLVRGRILGELDHPETRTGSNLCEAAIKYTRLSVVDDPAEPDRPFLAYEGVILDNPKGHQLHTLLRAGVDVGISTRGYAKMHKGTVKENGASVEANILDAYRLAGIDAVHNPSNEYGRIAHHENEEESDMLDDVTLEMLTESKPELVAEIRVAAANEAKAELQSAHEIAMETAKTVAAAAQAVAVAEAVAAAQAELQAKHDAALVVAKQEAATAQASAVTEAVTIAASSLTTPLTEQITTLEATVVAEQTRAASAATALTEAVAAKTVLETELSEAKTRLAEFDATALTRETEAKASTRLLRVKEVSEKAEYAPFALVLRKMLEAETAADLSDEFVQSKVALAENIWTASGKPKGMGIVQPGGTSQNVKDPVVEGQTFQGRHAALAGIVED
jgi:hypothetical protein